MSAAVWLPAKEIYPTSKRTLAGMLAKGWVERQLNASVGATYRITAAGQAALKAKIPLD